MHLCDEALRAPPTDAQAIRVLRFYELRAKDGGGARGEVIGAAMIIDDGGACRVGDAELAALATRGAKVHWARRGEGVVLAMWSSEGDLADEVVRIARERERATAIEDVRESTGLMHSR